MAVDWGAVEILIKEGSTAARAATDIDSAVDTYSAKIIEALQLMLSTASVDGGTCVDGGPVTAAVIT